MVSIPVVLDTDLGSDIDDHWAVAFLLARPELDVRLITVASGDTTYRAELLGRLLVAAGRTDIPIGIGPRTVLPDTTTQARRRQEGWPDRFPDRLLDELASAAPLSAYPGRVIDDGVQAIVDTVLAGPEPITIIAIGPFTNIGAALDRAPDIADRARLVGMAGFIRRNPWSDAKPGPEYNTLADIPAIRRVFAADWEITITPVDTCARTVLDGERYQRLLAAGTPIVEELLTAYRLWLDRFPYPEMVSDIDRMVTGGTAAGSPMIQRTTTTTCDPLAIALAYREDFVELETIQAAVTDAGAIVESPTGRSIRAALVWRDYDAFLDHYLDSLLSL